MQNGETIMGTNRRWLIFGESPIHEPEHSSYNDALDHEEENPQDVDEDQCGMLDATKCMLLKSLKKPQINKGNKSPI
jgi:hypothetical protein